VSLAEPMPVILILFDAFKRRAYKQEMLQQLQGVMDLA